MSASMTHEAALRIALAARDLPGVTPAALVKILADRLALPLTETKLDKVTGADLGEILAGGAPDAALKSALRLLCGVGVTGSDLPVLDAYRQGDMPGSIRVACASNNDELIDGHFGSCERFLIYQLTPAEIRLIAVRPTLEADHAEDRNLSRANLIADCQMVYLQSIGGPAAAKVVRVGVHPVKLQKGGGGPARAILAQLQQILASPPPWLAKFMGVEAASLVAYRELAEATSEA